MRWLKVLAVFTAAGFTLMVMATLGGTPVRVELEPNPLPWVLHAEMTADPELDELSFWVALGTEPNPLEFRISREDGLVFLRVLPSPGHPTGIWTLKQSETQPGLFVLGNYDDENRDGWGGFAHLPD